uniref:Uncharacterized protein n=1 Tax=Lepeophtheirus salmonis TaxID=72036 RepID=A0A0K2U7N7_LEPSM
MFNEDILCIIELDVFYPLL